MSAFRNRRGFTLVEVMAAIALSGLAITGGVMLFRQLDVEARRIRAASASASRAANGERLLRALLRNADMSSNSEPFRGDEQTVSYTSWCASPSGWMEQCSVLLSIDRRSDSSAVVARLSSGEKLVLGAFAGSVELRYVDLDARQPVWQRSWNKDLALPGAIAFVRERDTAVFAVGAARD